MHGKGRGSDGQDAGEGEEEVGEAVGDEDWDEGGKVQRRGARASKRNGIAIRAKRKEP